MKESGRMSDSCLKKSETSSKLKWALLFLIAAGLALLFFYRHMLWIRALGCSEVLHHPKHLKGLILSSGRWGPVIYILIQVLQVVVAPIPGSPIEFLGGYLFGVKAGFFYSMAGLILGSVIAFGLARLFEKWAIEKLVSPKVLRKFDYLTSHQGIILSFLLYLIPVFPKDALCYLLGLTPMHLGIFLIVSTLGRMPGTWIATLQGAETFNEQYRMLAVLTAISAGVILIFYIYHEEIHGWIKKLRRIEGKG
jgi:uncharacterized membrane protein YdjX (TVP38/TMEM64 family)